jgi:GDP-L-fucose synthase
MKTSSRIFVAGHNGMVGSALVRRLEAQGFQNLVTRSHAELDLTDQAAVNTFFKNEKIDAVFLAAAKVGGIYANNTFRADFIYQNLMIQANVIHAAYTAGIQRLLFLGSSCIYPRQCPQPMKESFLLSGYLEPTNEPYAVAKIAGIKLCESYNRQHGTQYRAVMPTNLYGPNDNFDLQTSHVLPAMIRKLHLARLAARGDLDAIETDVRRYGAIPTDLLRMLKSGRPDIQFWGTGAPRREFIHVDDMAQACIFVMKMSDDDYTRACGDPDSETGLISHLNVGRGKDNTIAELSDIVARIVGYEGVIRWNPDMPDGTMIKLLDVSRLNRAGWTPAIELENGIRQTYAWYLEN